MWRTRPPVRVGLLCNLINHAVLGKIGYLLGSPFSLGCSFEVLAPGFAANGGGLQYAVGREGFGIRACPLAFLLFAHGVTPSLAARFVGAAPERAQAGTYENIEERSDRFGVCHVLFLKLQSQSSILLKNRWPMCALDDNVACWRRCVLLARGSGLRDRGCWCDSGDSPLHDINGIIVATVHVHCKSIIRQYSRSEKHEKGHLVFVRCPVGAIYRGAGS